MVMVQDHQISKTKACKIVGFSRSAFYKSTVDWAAKDAPVIDALNEMIAKRARWGFWKCFHRLRSDGPEMTSEKFIEWAKEEGIVLMFIQPGKPNQNAFVERFNRSLRDEVLNANLFNSVDQAQEAADDWVQDYNEFRPHESLGDVAPMEFMPRKFVKEISSFELST